MNKKILCVSTFIITALFVSGVLLFFRTVEKPAGANSKGCIIVEMTNFRNNEGWVMVGLYNNEKGFPGTTESMTIRAKGEIADKKSRIEFKDVPYGAYAVSGYHDENKNEKLDTGMFGIPKEGIIASNNSSGNFGPAKFRDAKFELKSPDMRIEIKVKNY